MTKPGEAKLSQLFQSGRIGKFKVKTGSSTSARCVLNCNGRDGTITPRELARVSARRKYLIMRIRTRNQQI